MRVAYITTYDSSDRHNWSGSGYSIRQGLVDQDIAVEAIGPLTTNYEILGRLSSAFYRRLFGLTFAYERESLPCRGYAHQVGAMLKGRDFDVVLSPGTIPVSQLKCAHPLVIYADATFASYIAHYGLAQTLCARTIRAGHATDRLAYKKAALLIFASQWAADSAVTDYQVSPDKIRVIPFGANFSKLPTQADVLASINARRSDCCELITIGVEWVRKGVPRAIELTGLLNQMGLPTRLTVVGCQPPPGAEIPDFVKIEGFVDKRKVKGEERISSLLSSSHFHVLFSVAEAFGVVFAEANAHGVPNIASDVGGIPTAVINGRGGQRFAPDAPLSQVADYVAASVRTPNTYRSLAMNARREFEGRLNWDHCGAQLRRCLEEVVSDRADRQPQMLGR